MDSLDKINFTFDGIGEGLQKYKLQVPLYQRSYKWEKSHVQELLKDLSTAIDNNEEEYFLGTIVLIKDESDRLQVVDGQQRLATISILIAAIRNYFKDEKGSERANHIDTQYLFEFDLKTTNKVPKIKLNAHDNEFYVKKILECIEFSKNDMGQKKESNKRISVASDLAKGFVQKTVEDYSKPADRLIKWIDYIEKQLKVIWLTVPTAANAFVIFETLNDRGIELAISDLLKNYLFGLSKNEISEVQQKWTSMVSVMESISDEKLVITFLRHLWLANYGLVREKDLYGAIKGKIKTKKNAIEFADNLESKSKLYAALLQPDNEFWDDYGSTARDHIRTIRLIRMEQSRPLLLAIVEKYSITEVKKSLKLIVSWAVRFQIVGKLGGGVIETKFAQCAQKVSSGKVKKAKDLFKTMGKIVPKDNEFEAAFSSISISKHYLARYYFRTLEKKNNEKSDLVVDTNEENVNLEHILPESPSFAWVNWDSDLVKEYYKRLGNMALLNTKVNDQVGNKGFKEKLKHYKKSSIQLTKAIEKYKTWETKDIDQRQKELAKIALKAWPYKI